MIYIFKVDENNILINHVTICQLSAQNNLLIILDDIISHILSDTASNLKERKQIFVNINSKKY